MTSSVFISQASAAQSADAFNGFYSSLLRREVRLVRHPVESIRFIVIHCTATRCDRPYPPEQLERDHRSRGFRTTGYHFYIRRDGSLYHPRMLGEEGAHAQGYNRCSVGIAYEGGLDLQGHPCDTRTPQQKERLLDLLRILKQLYPQALIVGHHDLNPRKACPCFDAGREYRDVSFQF